MKQLGWGDRFAVSADLQEEALPGQTVVELFGERRVLIEHHCGITEYSRDRICVRVKYGVVRICGSSLRLAKMTADQLVVTGRIDSIGLVRSR